MSQEWMIDVLVDLHKFAKKNNLGQLTEQLQDTIHVATAELDGSARKDGAFGAYDLQTGTVHRIHQL
jgi:hypothetical protein